MGLQRLRDALAEKSQRVDSLQSELTTMKQSMARSSADREELATAKTNAAAALEDLKGKLAAIEIENENMKAEKAEALEEKDKLNAELDRLLNEEDERTTASKNELERRLKELNQKEEERKEAVL